MSEPTERTSILDSIEQVRNLLAFPDTDDPAWQLEEVRKRLGVTVGKEPEEITDRMIWAEVRDMDREGIAEELVREAMLADPRIQSIRIDFLDAGRHPFIWLALLPNGDEDEEEITLDSYEGPVDPQDLFSIANELLMEVDEKAELEFKREELLPEA